jgi:MFS family permease
MTTTEQVQGYSGAAPQAPDAALSRHRYYVLAMVLAAYALNTIDRNIINILQQSIKVEFGLADWQLGLMTGAVFAFFYSTLGLPAARLIDKGVARTWVMSGAVALWSVMTALCGAAQSYGQLLLARAGVGIGEAACGPSALTLISDYFPLKQRARAMGIFALGVPIGSLAGLGIGGWAAQAYGWRAALMIVGIPGLVLALLFRLTVREPARGQADGRQEAFEPMTMGQVLCVALRNRSLVQLTIAASLASFASVAGLIWFPSFFMRSFGLGPAQVGAYWGLMAGVTGIAGSLLAGWLTDRLGARTPRAMMLIPGAAMAVCLPFVLLAVSTDSWRLAFAYLTVPAMVAGFWLPPMMTMGQSLSPLPMRALMASFLGFALCMMGYGVGPLVMGGLSDAFTAMTGSSADGLRWALAATAVVYPWSALHFWLGSRAIERDLPR